MSVHQDAVITEAVTALFVPGDRPDRYAKAAGAGADLVIVDLEDAVVDDHRDQALEQVCAALGSGLRAVVRITDPHHPRHPEQLARLAGLAAGGDHGLLGVMIPKAADAVSVQQVAQALADGPMFVPLIALIESAVGVAAATEIARTSGVARLAFGALDFSLDVGAESDSQTTAFAAAQVVLASRLARRPGPLATPSVQISDSAAITAAARQARRDGFGGQLCIHPAQLSAVREGFRPSEAEQRWAEQVLAAERERGSGALQVDGAMIDRPLLERARMIQARRA